MTSCWVSLLVWQVVSVCAGGVQCGEEHFSSAGWWDPCDWWTSAWQRGIIFRPAQPGVSGRWSDKQDHKSLYHTSVIIWRLLNNYVIYWLLSSLFFLVLPQGHSVPMDSVIGCIRDFKMNEVVIGEAEASHKTLPCFDGLTEMGTYFGGGHIVLGLTHFIDPDVLFYFPVVSVCYIKQWPQI